MSFQPLPTPEEPIVIGDCSCVPPCKLIPECQIEDESDCEFVEEEDEMSDSE